MPAKNIQRIDREGVYSHIYNRGVARRTIFNESQDYETFLTYLKDYLTPQTNPENTKQTFTVKGRIFRGIPHQPKNYFDQVELIAYSLMSNHFHLLLHQKTRGSQEKFIRSLCTRYSMYFNKKYQRTGSLFEGPYKSVQVGDASHLLHLTRYFHHHPKGNDKNLTNGVSSYEEFLSTRETAWVKPKVVLSFFDKSENDSFKGVNGYRNFVEKYEPDQKEKELLEGITLENEVEHLEGRMPALAGRDLPEEPVFDPDLQPRSKTPEFAAVITVFVLLFTLGVRNIRAFATKTIASVPSPTPQVAGIEVEEEKPETIVVIKVNDGSTSVNIRLEPTVQSDKIGEAKDGDTFEFVSINSDWYEIRRADGSAGFISARYAQIGKTDN